MSPPQPSICRYPICYWGKVEQVSERMKTLSQSRNDTQLWIFLVAKLKSHAIQNNICIGIWNVRSMSQVNWKWKLLQLRHKWSPMCCSNNRSAVSDSLWPHGLQSLWNSPGQNTGVGSPSLLQGNLPNPGNNPRSPSLQADSLPADTLEKPKVNWMWSNRRWEDWTLTF